MLTLLVLSCIATVTLADPEACGASRPRVIVANNGQFTSPNHPSDYPNNANCQWRLTSEDASSRVRLEFNPFVTETRYDTVSIYDGDSSSDTNLGSISGVQNGASYESSGSSLFVAFTSDSSITESGFIGKFTTDLACFDGGNRILSDSQGSFTSPYYPADYGTNMNCTWTIQANSGFVPVLEFESFELEFEPNCEWDHIDILDGSDLVGRFCGNNTPPAIVGSSGSISVVFRMDQSIVRGGFNANYQIVLEGSTPFFSTTQGTGPTNVPTQPTPPPIDDDIIPPILVVAINGSYTTDDSSDITPDCGALYSNALRDAARNMILILYEFGFCPDTDIYLATADTVGYVDGNTGLFKFDFNLLSGLRDTPDGLEACGREISAFTRIFNHWEQPLIPQYPGCPKVVLQSGDFGDLGQYYDCLF